MNFHFTEEEQDILDMLKDFCVKEVPLRRPRWMKMSGFLRKLGTRWVRWE